MMRFRFVRRLVAAVAMAACFIPAAMSAATVSATQWALSYEGKSTNQFMGDKRAVTLIRTRVPSRLSDQVLSALGGPPDPVLIAGRRYVAVSACVPHDCPDRGFFWLDTQTGVGLGAHFAGDQLELASNGLSATNIPAAARKALADWLTYQELVPTSLAFIDRANQLTPLDAAAFAVPVPYQPAAGGPSYACTAAVSRSEKAICGDAGLSRLDLELAKLVHLLRHGVASTVEQTQLRDLQRAWLARRDADCAAAPELVACLAEQYRVQYTRLENWVPAR